MRVEELVKIIQATENYQLEGKIDPEFDVILNWIRNYISNFKKECRPGLVPFYEEKENDLSDIESYLSNLNNEEIDIVKKNIEKIIKGIYGNSVEAGKQDFNSRFNHKDFCNTTANYFLMIKCNKEQTFSINYNNFYDVMNSAIRGNRMIEFKELLAVITHPKFAEMMKKNAFKDGNASTLQALSNRLDSSDKKPFDYNNVDEEVNSFMRGRINKSVLITDETTPQERMKINLEEDKEFNLETIERASAVNQELYKYFQDRISVFEMYDKMSIEQAKRYLDFIKYIEEKCKRFIRSQYEVVLLEVMKQIDIINLTNEDLFKIVSKLSIIRNKDTFNDMLNEMMVNHYQR